jgi:hypothetical protein
MFGPRPITGNLRSFEKIFCLAGRTYWHTKPTNPAGRPLQRETDGFPRCAAEGRRTDAVRTRLSIRARKLADLPQAAGV